MIANNSFAADMMSGSDHMMMSGAMMSDTMTKNDHPMMATGHMIATGDSMIIYDDKDMIAKKTMMHKDYKKLTVAMVTNKMGYMWKTDRKMLATKSGIVKYTGTKKQNMKIKEYLLTMAQ